MESINLPSHQAAAFERECEKRGLNAAGFDVSVRNTGADRSQIVILVGQREFRYSTEASEHAWMTAFFDDVTKEGDHGDGVTFASSREERGAK
jgi:hypothetical protein